MNESEKNRYLGAIAGVGVGLIIVLLLYTLISTRTLIGQVRDSQKSNTSTVNVIRDCTEPDGKCFKDGQRRTARAVGDISLAQIAAVACADQPGFQSAQDVALCVQRTIKALKR